MPQKKKSKRTTSAQDNSGKAFAKTSAVSALLSLVVFFLMIFVFSAIMSKKEIPSSIVNVLPFFACAVAGFIGGKLITKGEGKRMILQILLSGVFVISVICIVLFLAVGTIGLRTLAAFGLILLFYVLGAFFRFRRKPKRKI